MRELLILFVYFLHLVKLIWRPGFSQNVYEGSTRETYYGTNCSAENLMNTYMQK